MGLTPLPPPGKCSEVCLKISLTFKIALTLRIFRMQVFKALMGHVEERTTS
jgi:hypothetical protein